MPPRSGRSIDPVDAADQAHQVAVRELHALGRAGRARGVDQGQQVVGLDLGDRRPRRRSPGRSPRARSSVWSPPSPSITITCSISGRSARAWLKVSRNAVSIDRDLGAGVASRRTGSAPARRSGRSRTGPRRARRPPRSHRDELGPVVEHQRDGVALADAELRPARRRSGARRSRSSFQLTSTASSPSPARIAIVVAEPLDGGLEGERQVRRVQLRSRSAARVPLRRCRPPSLSSSQSPSRCRKTTDSA